MKLPFFQMLQKVAPQTNLRPAGVWDFMARPESTPEGREEKDDFERMWALAEREAFAAGELQGPSVAAQ